MAHTGRDLTECGEENCYRFGLCEPTLNLHPDMMGVVLRRICVNLHEEMMGAAGFVVCAELEQSK